MSQLELGGELGAIDVPQTVIKSAVISECGVYRYELRREFGGGRPLVTIGVNPSTADAIEDDQTIFKDIGFATRWGCGLLVKGNGNAFRARDPQVMKRAAKAGIDIVGPDNDRYLRAMFALVRSADGILLVSWGNHLDPRRQVELAYLMDECEVAPMCLGINKNGTPKHELYLPYTTPLVPWDCP